MTSTLEATQATQATHETHALTDLLAGTPYVSYAYAYPHKTAYRPFAPPIPLREVWADEDRDALSLYIHIPFCEMRCGFCNLFTSVNPASSFTAGYLAALEREAERVQAALGDATFTRMALGGGTPTYLGVADLACLFDLAERRFGVVSGTIPISVEASPATAAPEKLRLLRERGVDRVSLGVQSFVEAEARAAGRSQRTAEVEYALESIRTAGFPTLNIDLIYGLPGQTVESCLASLRAALRYAPDELFLYPLYVRPLTGLARRDAATDASEEPQDIRLACYRAARELLGAAGYAQVGMRMFHSSGRSASAPAEAGPDYCVQDDGMVGLGCGARSYTRACHYSTEYAVGAKAVRAVLAAYVARSAEWFDAAHYGAFLDGAEQRRRYTISALLDHGGLSRADYQHRFGGKVLDDLPQLAELVELGLAVSGDGALRLTDTGIERADTIGPWLYSPAMRARMGGYRLR
jgi:oxygen-independent coproporphyrinogen-3 oxidase